MSRMRSVTRRGFLAGAGLALGLAACASDAGEDADGDADASAKGSEEDELADAEDAARDAEGTDDADGAGGADDDTADDGPAVTALHVEGTALVNEAGSAVQLRGVSTHGLAWYPEYVNEALFGELADEWGADVVRLALYTADSGGWCTDGDQDELREVVDRGVQAAVAAGLYVIVDWHVLNDCDPNVYVDEAVAFFADVSTAYADLPNVIYEICNEPNGSATWADVKAYAAEVLPVIRANAPDALVLVGTPNWSQCVDQAAVDPIEGDDNLMYTLHFYAATHTEALRATLREAVEGGLPVFVSEYGICDASGAGSNDYDSADAWVALMDELGVSYVAWNLSNKDEASALIASSCAKTSGFAAEDLSESGAWLVDMLGGALAGDAAADDEDADDEDADDEGSDFGSSGTSASDAGTASTDGLTATWELRGSWESGGASYLQYDIDLQNGTGAAIAGWEIVVTFNGAIGLSDGWNGSYSASGSTLTIANASYNGSIQAGDTAYDIGFIVSGAEGLAIESVSAQAS